MNLSGIDISKESFDASIEEKGVVKVKKYVYDESGMKEYLNRLPQGVHCIMESTGVYHLRLSYFLHQHGVSLSIVNPLSVKRFSQALMLRAKTDKLDCRLLLEYGKHFELTRWQPSESYFVELQQLLKFQEQLIEENRAISNQLESLNYSVVQSHFVKEKQKERLFQINQLIKEVDNNIEKLVKEHEAATFELLTQIPGIGKKTAVVLISVTKGMKNFESSKQLCSYFGLSPRIYESGSSVKGKAKICKMGMGLIRKLLYMCALSAKRANKSCREFYQRLLEKGKSKKLALIAVANKLLRQAFSIVKNKTIYNENFFIEKFAY